MSESYPKFKYHKEHGAKIVSSKEEESSLGSEWADTPAAFGIETHPEAKKKEKFFSITGEVYEKEVVEEAPAPAPAPKKSPKGK